MAKSFDELVKRTAGKRTQEIAARRAKELLGALLLSEVRKLAGKSQRPPVVVRTLPIRTDRQA